MATQRASRFTYPQRLPHLAAIVILIVIALSLTASANAQILFGIGLGHHGGGIGIGLGGPGIVPEPQRPASPPIASGYRSHKAKSAKKESRHRTVKKESDHRTVKLAKAKTRAGSDSNSQSKGVDETSFPAR